MNIHSHTPRARIMVVDDHSIVRDGLAVLLEKDRLYEVVASVGTGREAILAAQDLRPEVVLMDLVLPDLNGIDATEHILGHLPAARVIILSASHSAEHVHRALRAGALGYVSKYAVVGEISQAVDSVIKGQRFLSPSIAHLGVAGMLNLSLSRSPIERLTTREREVLHRICAGASSAEIARHLYLSRKTVDTYRGRLMSKLGVGNRAALIRFAIEHEMTTQ